MESNGATYNVTPSIDDESVADPRFPRKHGEHDRGPSTVSLSHCLDSILSVLSIPFENRHIVVDTDQFIIQIGDFPIQGESYYSRFPTPPDYVYH